jgi:hypothetical protein
MNTDEDDSADGAENWRELSFTRIEGSNVR